MVPSAKILLPVDFWITAHAEQGLPPMFRSLESGEQPGSPNEWLSQMDREELCKVERKLGKEGQILFAGGDLPEAICYQADKLHADLVVIGRSPKADDVGTTHTTSFTIIRESPCPVVSI
jgi:nucleotide-binding universal stress UspA family protein